jgi:hypothetical protein
MELVQIILENIKFFSKHIILKIIDNKFIEWDDNLIIV